MEQLIHYVWKHKMFPLTGLKTTDGQEVEVIDPGLHNRNAGPDFFNAKVKINGTLWVGNVEIHDRASDWLTLIITTLYYTWQHLSTLMLRLNEESIHHRYD